MRFWRWLARGHEPQNTRRHLERVLRADRSQRVGSNAQPAREVLGNSLARCEGSRPRLVQMRKRA